MQKKGLVSPPLSHDSICFVFWIRIACLLIFVILFSGCRSTTSQGAIKRYEGPRIKQVLVLPFENVTHVYGENITFRNPISGKVFVTGSVGSNAEVVMTELMTSRIAAVKSYRLIPPEQAEGIISSQDENSRYNEPLSRILEMGRRLEADAVIVGYLFRFKERVGKKYAVDFPASVAFDLNMVSTRSGELIWEGHFDETQQSLSENLLLIGKFIKRGGAWVTAGQMAADGLDDLIPKMIEASK